MKTVILTIFVFGVIIMLHESGHFLFAKLFHVKVEEFSFGMGPKLWSRIKRGTQYTIRAFPIGGYVAMEGEDDAGSGAVVREKIVSAAEGGPLYEKPAWQRFIIMAAGAVMNVILGFIILIVVTAMSGLIGTTTVAVFDEDSVSANYLQAGDEIIKVNGYNEDLLEWGHEDAEFAYRLHFAGVRKKALKMGGIMYHLYHKEASKAQENMHKDVLNQVKKERLVRCTNGIDQYL